MVVVDRVEGVEHPGAFVDLDRVLLEVGLSIHRRVVARDPERDILHAATSRSSIPSRSSET